MCAKYNIFKLKFKFKIFTDLSNTKSKKFQQSRAANALFCGLILGFIFSFLVAYSGVINDNGVTDIDYSITDFVM